MRRQLYVAFLLPILMLSAASCSRAGEKGVASLPEESGGANLVASGQSRQLPDRLLGLQVIPLYEHLIDDPAKVAIAREMAPAFTRFPGGMIGNYYNWRTGQLEFDVRPDSNATYRFFARAAEQIKPLNPQGVYIGPYAEFSKSIGAETVLLVNLETSTAADQAAWFEKMRREGVLPRFLELGNEFWLAMLGDPNVLKKWPDVQTTMRTMKEYRDTLSPYFVSGTKVAVQATAGRFYARNQDGKLVTPSAMKAWDEALRPEPWFDAVTIHLYPEMNSVVGAGERDKLPANMNTVFPAMMARCDQGVDDTLAAVEKQLPGKGIWVTEWSGYQWGGAAASSQASKVYGLHVHLTTRMLMTYLRHPSVTMTHYHMLNFSGGPMSLYRPDPEHGGYAPTSAAVILKWFNQAANGGATYQRFRVAGASWVESTVTPQEGYYDVDAVLLRKGKTATLFIHNAGAVSKSMDVSSLGLGTPASIEAALIDPAGDYTRDAPPVRVIPAASLTEVPPYSLVRVVWQ